MGELRQLGKFHPDIISKIVPTFFDSLLQCCVSLRSTLARTALLTFRDLITNVRDEMITVLSTRNSPRGDVTVKTASTRVEKLVATLLSTPREKKFIQEASDEAVVSLCSLSALHCQIAAALGSVAQSARSGAVTSRCGLALANLVRERQRLCTSAAATHPASNVYQLCNEGKFKAFAESVSAAIPVLLDDKQAESRQNGKFIMEDLVKLALQLGSVHIKILNEVWADVASTKISSSSSRITFTKSAARSMGSKPESRIPPLDCAPVEVRRSRQGRSRPPTSDRPKPPTSDKSNKRAPSIRSGRYASANSASLVFSGIPEAKITDTEIREGIGCRKSGEFRGAGVDSRRNIVESWRSSIESRRNSTAQAKPREERGGKRETEGRRSHEIVCRRIANMGHRRSLSIDTRVAMPRVSPADREQAQRHHAERASGQGTATQGTATQGITNQMAMRGHGVISQSRTLVPSRTVMEHLRPSQRLLRTPTESWLKASPDLVKNKPPPRALSLGGSELGNAIKRLDPQPTSGQQTSAGQINSHRPYMRGTPPQEVDSGRHSGGSTNSATGAHTSGGTLPMSTRARSRQPSIPLKPAGLPHPTDGNRQQAPKFATLPAGTLSSLSTTSTGDALPPAPKHRRSLSLCVRKTERLAPQKIEH